MYILITICLLFTGTVCPKCHSYINKSHLAIALFFEQSCSFKALIYSNFCISNFDSDEKLSLCRNCEKTESVTTNYRILLQGDNTIPQFISISLHFCLFEVLRGI